MCNWCNNLLYALSARQVTSWSAFKELLQGFYPQMVLNHDGINSADELRRHFVRTLDLLGHCEFEFDDDQKVYVSPPVLALLPAAKPITALVCGARSPRAINALGNMAKSESSKNEISVSIRSYNRDAACAPEGIYVTTSNAESLALLANQLGYKYSDIPPAWTILNFAGSVRNYIDSREWGAGLSLNWQSWGFDMNRLAFSKRPMGNNLLTRYEDPIRLTPRFYLKQGNAFARVDLDWGRYAALLLAGANVLAYDEMRELLAVPCGAPLPRLFARVLGLCSGHPPAVVNFATPLVPEAIGQQSYYLFKAVPSAIAYGLANKLGQSLICRSIEL